MKYLYIIPVLLFIVSCSVGPIPIYDEQPIIKILDYNNNISFVVPDIDGNGWGQYQGNDIGTDTVELNISLTMEDADVAYIEYIECLYYSDNNFITNDFNELLIPKKIMKNDTIDLNDFNIILNENIANYIDYEDGFVDMYGDGIVEVYVIFTDEMGNRYSSVPIRIPFILTE